MGQRRPKPSAALLLPVHPGWGKSRGSAAEHTVQKRGHQVASSVPRVLQHISAATHLPCSLVLYPRTFWRGQRWGSSRISLCTFRLALPGGARSFRAGARSCSPRLGCAGEECCRNWPCLSMWGHSLGQERQRSYFPRSPCPFHDPASPTEKLSSPPASLAQALLVLTCRPAPPGPCWPKGRGEALTGASISAVHTRGPRELGGMTERQASDRKRPEAEQLRGGRVPALAFLSLHPVTGEDGRPGAAGEQRRV